MMITNLDSRDPTERSRCFATNPWRRVHYSSAVQIDIRNSKALANGTSVTLARVL